METYIDDMLIKSIKAIDHIKELEEAFKILRCYQMKLIIPKCIFGVTSSKFLRFLDTNQGIEANLGKIKAILNIKYPFTKKEVQQLTRCIAALS